MSNSPCIGETSKHVQQLLDEGVRICIHLTLSEGLCCGNANYIPHLVDDNGALSCSFGKLLLMSYIPGIRTKYKNEIAHELNAQIQNAKSEYALSELNIDGHMHYHMLPIVFDALYDISHEQKLNFSYIRQPSEPLSPYFNNFKLSNFISLNLIKVAVLKVLVKRNRRRVNELTNSSRRTLFFGTLLSGKMFYDDVAKLLPDINRLANLRDADVELLFHPGGTSNADEVRTLTNKADIEFLSSENRSIEAGALIKLKGNLKQCGNL
jgi:hypothetical protein